MQIADVKMRGQFGAKKWGQFCRNIHKSTCFSILLFAITLSSFGQKITNNIELKKANSILTSFLKVSNKLQYEYNEARESYYYDIDKDGDKDLVSFFTLEGLDGGNNWQYCVAIFIIENSIVKEKDVLLLYGDAMKKYQSGKLLEFKDGYVYYRLFGTDFFTNEKYVETVGITFLKGKIVTKKKRY